MSGEDHNILAQPILFRIGFIFCSIYIKVVFAYVFMWFYDFTILRQSELNRCIVWFFDKSVYNLINFILYDV